MSSRQVQYALSYVTHIWKDSEQRPTRSRAARRRTARQRVRRWAARRRAAGQVRARRSGGAPPPRSGQGAGRPDAREDLAGRKLGEFLLRERIGVGGFGAVYRCEQPLLGREAVVKVLHPRLRRDDGILQRFAREAQLAARLDHPYAVHIYAFGIERDDGLFWIAMEKVHGITLEHWLRDRGPLPLAQLVPLFDGIAEVVHTAHELGIVHRDLKPANVMVIERAGRLLPKLLDLGVAKQFDGTERGRTPACVPAGQGDDGESLARCPDARPDATLPGATSFAGSLARSGPSSRLTVTGVTVGSPPYMPPEQWAHPDAVGPSADIYALGVLAYEALTGHRPFSAPTRAGYADQHRHAAVPPLRAGFSQASGHADPALVLALDPAPALDPALVPALVPAPVPALVPALAPALAPALIVALDRVLQRAMAKQPEDRWSTALELAAALRAAATVCPRVCSGPRGM
jgi:eukaryotic-like serine/threonine-protein kinase